MLSCDLVVAADHAMFGIPEAKRGLIAGAGGLIRMPKRLPMAVALEMAMTGDPIDAPRALALGLVNRVVPAASLLDEALALAETHRRQRTAGRALLQERHEARRRAPRIGGMEDQRRGGRRRVLVGRCHGGARRLRREAAPEGRASRHRDNRARPGPPVSPHPPRPGRAIWVGGSSDGSSGRPGLARASPLAWPAYAVLVLTGFWNSDLPLGRQSAWGGAHRQAGGLAAGQVHAQRHPWPSAGSAAGLVSGPHWPWASFWPGDSEYWSDPGAAWAVRRKGAAE